MINNLLVLEKFLDMIARSISLFFVCRCFTVQIMTFCGYKGTFIYM